MKRAGLFFVVMVSSLLFIQLTSAYYFPSARSFTQDIVDTYVGVFEPILQALFGGFGWSGLYLFERFLLFILLMSLIFVILGNGRFPMFEKNSIVRWIVAIVVPLIGIRFVNFEWLTALLLSYQAFAIALTTAVPLIVFLFFVHGIGKEYPHMRKVLWVLFIGIYIGLWSTTTTSGASAAYFWTFVAAVLFLLFDTKIEEQLYKYEQRKANKYWKLDAVANLRHDITMLRQSGLPPHEMNEAIKRKEDHINTILKSKSYP